MSLSKYERGNTIQSTITFKQNDVATDPSGGTAGTARAYITVYKPDGTTLFTEASGTRTSTGTFRYYIPTDPTDPLGIYVVQWRAMHNVGGAQGYLDIYQRDAFQIVDVEQ